MMKIFKFLDTGERYVPTSKLFDELDGTHTVHYIFAKQFVENKVLLDAGCGYGYGCDYLAKSGARRVIGVDISREAIEFAKTHYARDNLEFIVMDCTRLAFRNNLFDAVISFEVIEHIHHTEQYLSETERALKPNGIFVLSTPNKKVGSPGLEKPVLPFHVIEFTAEELYHLVGQHFKDIKIFGKKIVNEQILEKETRFKRSRRFRLVVRLSQYDLIRKVSRTLPLKVRQIFTGSVCSCSKADDFEISTSYVEEAPTLIALCKNK